MKIAYLYSDTLNWYSEATKQVLESFGNVTALSNKGANYELEGFDVVYVEYIGEGAIHASRQDIKNLIIRTHGIEVYMSGLQRVDWNRVTTLVTMTKHQADYFKTKIQAPDLNYEIMRYPAPTRQFSLSKELDPSRISCIANITGRKGYDQILEILDMYDGKTVHAAGEVCLYGEPVFEYLNYNLGKKGYENRFSWRKHVEWGELDRWMEGSGYHLLASVEESFGKVVLESMLKGMSQLIRNWAGADEIWPTEFIYENVSDLNKIFKMPFEPEKWREWVAQKFSLKKIKEEFEKLV